MSDQAKQGEAQAAQVREKAIKDRTLPQIQSWPVDPETGKPMTVFVAMASDLVPTVPFGNVTIQSTIMRPVPAGEAVDLAELTQDIENGRQIQKAVEYIVGTERRLLQWALDPQARIQSPTTGAEFTGEGERFGAPETVPGAPVVASPAQPQPPAGAPAQPPVQGAPAVGGDSGAQVG